MKYTLNQVKFNIKLKQPIINESETDFHHRDLINGSPSWYGRGYVPIQMSNGFFKNIREHTYQYIAACAQKALAVKLETLTSYHFQVSSDEAHMKVINRVGKLIKPAMLGIDVEELSKRIKKACSTDINLYCRDVCDIRIFRPYQGSSMDNNPLHRDTWLPALNNCVNVYIPVSGNNRLSSLSVIPGSHLWNRNVVKRTVSNACINSVQYGLPSVASIGRKYKVVRPALTDNEVLLFSSNLIHGGAVNLNKDITRVSIEIRFWTSAFFEEQP